jgi:hypothetical protein
MLVVKVFVHVVCDSISSGTRPGDEFRHPRSTVSREMAR